MRVLGSRLPPHIMQDRQFTEALRSAYKIVAGERHSDLCGELLEELIGESNDGCSKVSASELTEIALRMQRRDYLGSMVVRSFEARLPRRSDKLLNHKLRRQPLADHLPRQLIRPLLDSVEKMVGHLFFDEVVDRCAIVAERYRIDGTALLDWEGFYADPDLEGLRLSFLERLKPAFVSRQGRQFFSARVDSAYDKGDMYRAFCESDFAQLTGALFGQPIALA